MAIHRSIPILRTIINDQMDLYLALRGGDTDIAIYLTNKISTDLERIKNFLEREKEDG